MSIVRCGDLCSVWFSRFISLLSVPTSATWGVWSWRWHSAGGRAQHSWCGCTAEGVPQGHAWPSSDQGTLHSLHQHHTYASFFFLLPLFSLSIFFIQINPVYPTFAVLDADEQQNVTQLLIYLLPACNSDTLHRLLEFLSTVTDHAHDKQDKDGQEVNDWFYLNDLSCCNCSSSPLKNVKWREFRGI